MIDATLSYIRAADVDGAWPVIGPFLERLEKGSDGEVNAALVRDGAKQEQATIWVASRTDEVVSVAITRNEVWSGDRVCRLVGVSGSMAVIIGVLPQFEAIAKASGIKHFAFEARPGAERLLPDYRKTAVVLRKTFDV